MKCFLIIILFSSHCCWAQQDSLMPADTMLLSVPLPAKASVATLSAGKNFDSLVFTKNPFYHFANPIRQISSTKKWLGKEFFFYAAISLLLFFALVKNSFYKYLQDLFRLFFRTTLKQRQIKEQLMLAPLPSLLLNILFIISAALFINLLFEHYGLGRRHSFWILFLYTCLGLAAIYFIKFLTLKICGWLFKLSEATDAYTFIVFTTNKIMGIALLPFIVLLAFTTGIINEIVLTSSILLTGGMFLYRFYLSYASIHKQISINFFHFAVYLCAFEVVPLLLINKLLFRFLA